MKISVTRDPVVESVHEIDAVVCDTNGPKLYWGDPTRITVARSAIKYVQALPLLRTGAAERFSVTDEEVVLACSSHSAEPGHIEAVSNWLARIGLDEAALACGPDLPISDEAKLAILRAGGGPRPLYNGCSGKHVGFLTVARHLGVDHEGYIEPGHPVQELVSGAVADLCGIDVSEQQPGRDGCGIPTFGIPLDRLASAMARLVTPGELDAETAAAARRLIEVVPSRSWWVSGTGRHETEVAAVATEPVLLKGGAEGVFMAGLPARGLGLAVKAADGAHRAAMVGVSAVLAHLGVVPVESVADVVHNVAGVVVGTVTADSDEPVQV